MKKYYRFSLLLFIFLLPIHTNAQNGVVKTYYDDGAIESEISYVNDILDGVTIYYFQNGNVKEEIPFSLGKVNGPHRVYYSNGLLREEKNMAYGVMDGLSKIYHENGALKEALNYENGKLIKKIIVAYDSTYSAPLELYLAGNRQYKLSKEANIVSDAEICPVPVNGIKEIQKNLVYPKEAKQNRIEGTVTLSVKIDSTGKANGAEIVKSLTKECDLAAVSAVEKTKFLPGKKGNKAVESKIVVNVDFKVEDKPVSTPSLVQKVEREAVQLAAPPEWKADLKEKKEEQAKPVAAAEIKTAVPQETPVKEIKKELILSGSEQGNIPGNIPYPVGGIERILARTTTVPKKAIEQKIEGEVIFKIEVDKYGVVRDTKLIKGLGNGIDEAIEVGILDSPFKPALVNGQAVKGEVTLKIQFTYKK
jgi:TonB family protein